MPGKWAKFRGKIPAFELESSYQEKVDAFKLTFLGTKEAAGANVAMLAKEFAARKLKKEALEEKEKAINLELEGLSQLIVERLEDEGQEKVELHSGASVYLHDGVYPSVADKDALFEWIKKERMISLLSVHAQTLKGLVGDRLHAGQPPPPGVKVFLKTQARMKKPGGNGNDE